MTVIQSNQPLKGWTVDAAGKAYCTGEWAQAP